MIYWLKKFQFMGPYTLPHIMPKDPMTLGEMAVQKMISDVDPLTDIKGVFWHLEANQDSRV